MTTSWASQVTAKDVDGTMSRSNFAYVGMILERGGGAGVLICCLP